MIHLTATSIGPIAVDLLADHADVEVIAAFEHSFYLLMQGGLVCAGAESIGRGPINVTLAEADKVDWRQSGVFHEVKGQSHADRLVIGQDVTLSLASAERWQAPLWVAFDEKAAGRGLAALRALAAGRLPHEGLASLVFSADAGGARTPEAKAAAQQMRDLQVRMPQVLASEADDGTIRSLTLLLGLGPGLTPSGDDLIGGIMLALTALGRPGLRDSIWQALVPELGDLTTEISAMHLSAAADGLGAEAIHALANTVLAGNTRELPERLDRVAHIGHCSGWDTLAGFVLTMTAALRNANGAPASGG